MHRASSETIEPWGDDADRRSASLLEESGPGGRWPHRARAPARRPRTTRPDEPRDRAAARPRPPDRRPDPRLGDGEARGQLAGPARGGGAGL